MPLKLVEVTDASEFNALVQCECESYDDPSTRFFRLFRHDLSRAGFIELRDRQVREWQDDPTAKWVKVVDTELGDRIVAAAKWNVYERDPWAGTSGGR